MSKLIVIFIIALLRYSYGQSFGPAVKATRGEVWPKPQKQEKFANYFAVDPSTFSFKTPADIGCPEFLNNALLRYQSIIATQILEDYPKSKFKLLDDENYLGNLNSLSISEVQCSGEDVRPTLGVVEDYNLTITESEQVLAAKTIWGILRGLETFSQLIYHDQDKLFINTTTISDFPRFYHRGLHLDTARHFEPVYIILKMLDAMEYNKFNVFHWHLTDDQSFPYESRTFPELSEQGAYSPKKVYRQTDIAEIIEYARLRGIRVIAEFDIPGHTKAWGASHPELLSSCYGFDGEPNGEYGPMDPTKESTYKFLNSFFDEIVEVFPDVYIHLGGDEVEFGCWQRSADVTSFMESNNITTYEGLQTYFMNRVVNYLGDKGIVPIVWEEAFLNGVELKNFSAIVEVWRSENSLDTLSQVTAAHKLALYSSCWYLDHLENGGDWQKYYLCDPLGFAGTGLQYAAVLGGEACMWAEVVNEFNVISRVWPRASAAAERLWSFVDVLDILDARSRIEEHTCRMNARGIGAQPPNGAGACL